jgi:NADP-dependent 3-hydroxy acid dehydrogenase YdfG
VALVARNAEKLSLAVRELTARGVKAQAITGDVSTPEGARDAVQRARKALGTVSALHWNAYVAGAGDLLTAPLAELRPVLDVGTVCLLAAVQEVLPDLRAEKGAVLVTNGAFGLFDDGVDAYCVQIGAMGMAAANAAKHKLVRLLHHRLKPEGVFVGEVMVTDAVKGTVWDRGDAKLEGATIAAKFWELYEARGAALARV